MAKRFTVDEIIEMLGGGSAVAAMLRLRPSAVSNWRAAGAFPPGRAKMIALLAQRMRRPEITVAAVLDAQPGRRPRRAPGYDRPGRGNRNLNWS